ncbi:glycosyltransferase family 4 protein [Nostoc sp. CHAB 5834]|nr:glycosyltransferase family 4 protein [Nostoc sp. CHAB 5834]
MKILIISHEFPYPSNHGARYDIWNRILALKKEGVEIFLITWFELTKGDIPTTESIAHVRETLDELVMLRISRDIKRVWNITRYPSIVAGRLLNDNQYHELSHQVRKFAPTAIFTETVYPGLLALKLADDMSIPVYFRQHNIEHKYMKGQMLQSTSWKEKIVLSLSVIHLKKYESYVLSKADGFFDISANDLTFWENRGISKGYWLPPIYSRKCIDSSKIMKKVYDISFIGNLCAPNNLAGINWFIKFCLPKIISYSNEVRVLLAGSRPTKELDDLCKHHPNITLISNPKDISDIYKQSKLLINPVQFGSGVNIKSIDMLFQDNPVVCTAVGIQGLPAMFKQVFFVENDSIKFADTIINILSKKQSITEETNEARSRLRKIFTDQPINMLLDVLSKSSTIAI